MREGGFIKKVRTNIRGTVTDGPVYLTSWIREQVFHRHERICETSSEFPSSVDVRELSAD
jgi:hypothetical protein